jgi:ADP-heptose:LPS heptosyltransferase
VLCTAVFDAVKQRNPSCEIQFVSRYPELFSGHRSLSAVLPDQEAQRAGALPLVYAQVIPPPRPLTVLMAECVGLQLSGPLPPSLPEPAADPELQEAMAGWRKPLIVLQPQASRWTPNKDWPLARWNGLSRRLLEIGTVVECGADPVLDPVIGQVSMAGRTTVVQFAQLVRAADLFIGPPSGGMHLAAAFRIPSLILYGGYEHPDGHQYANVTPFYRQVSCAPCWLTSDCPVGRLCLDQISEDAVFAAAVDRLSSAR